MIRIATGALCALLDDLLLTTSPADTNDATASILLHTARGYRDPHEPGRSDILVGTSTTRWSVGHDHRTSEGQIDEPMLWHRTDVAGVVAVFKPMAKANEDHVVEIKRYSDTIIVQEQEDLFGHGTHLEFKTRATEKFPRDLVRLLEPPRGNLGLLARPSPRVDFSASQLDPFITIAKRRKAIMETYRYPGSTKILIQIGPRYRGLVVPVGLDDEAEQDPSSVVYPYKLPVVEDEVAAKVMDSAVAEEPALPLETEETEQEAEPVS